MEFGTCNDQLWGVVDKVMVAEFQADALLMDRSAKQLSFIVCQPTPTFQSLLGLLHCGGSKLVSTTEKTLEDEKNILSDPDAIIINQAKQPLFEGVDDRKLRAVIALFLGCDVFLPGLNGVGVQSMQRIIDMDVVNIYIKALLCEPTIIVVDN